MDILSTSASVVSGQKSETVHQNVYVYKTFFIFYCGIKSLYVGSTVYFSSILYVISVVYIDGSCGPLVDLITLRQRHECVYNLCYIIWRLRKIARSDYLLHHVCPSVCLRGTTLLPLEGF